MRQSGRSHDAADQVQIYRGPGAGGHLMSDLYDTDILLWSERQAELLRRSAAGERVSDGELDWPHIVEEIEDVGRSELRPVGPSCSRRCDTC
jgi:Domain of unknown function DUF29